MEITADGFREFFPNFGQFSDGELEPSLNEARDISPSTDPTVVYWLVAHLHTVRGLMAKGESATGGLETTTYGQHYAWRLRRESTLEIGT